MSNAGTRSSAFETVRPVVVLVVICMVAGALLGAVHYVTDPVAQANAEAKAQETYAHLVPKAQSKGYGGQVPIAVAFGPDGTVLSITAMANDETPGLGTKIANDSYIGQYVGLAAQPTDAGSIDLISGATISSKAALSAFNIAVEAYEEVH